MPSLFSLQYQIHRQGWNRSSSKRHTRSMVVSCRSILRLAGVIEHLSVILNDRSSPYIDTFAIWKDGRAVMRCIHWLVFDKISRRWHQMEREWCGSMVPSVKRKWSGTISFKQLRKTICSLQDDSSPISILLWVLAEFSALSGTDTVKLNWANGEKEKPLSWLFWESHSADTSFIRSPSVLSRYFPGVFPTCSSRNWKRSKLSWTHWTCH